jgi:hypothetical protein
MKRSHWIAAAGALALAGAASAAVAATRTGDERVPSPAREVREAAGYHTAFYPGFVRKMTVQRAGEEVVLYEQESPFVLPAGQGAPASSATVELRGGPAGRDLTLHLEGAIHGIDRIEVHFKPGPDGAPTERLIIEDAPTICPPNCEELITSGPPPAEAASHP